MSRTDAGERRLPELRAMLASGVVALPVVETLLAVVPAAVGAGLLSCLSGWAVSAEYWLL